MTVGAVSANCLSRPHPGPIIRSPAGLRQDGTALVFLNAQNYGSLRRRLGFGANHRRRLGSPAEPQEPSLRRV
jgi:hypothetical protein